MSKEDFWEWVRAIAVLALLALLIKFGF